MDENRFLKLVTVTGADDSVRHEDLLMLAKEYPYVEFGIQLDPERHPSQFCLFGLQKLAARGVRFSGHICGQWAREIFSGRWTIFEKWPGLQNCFSRLQINVEGDPGDVSRFIWPFRLGKKALVIRMNEANGKFLKNLRERGVLPVGLYKRSASGRWPESTGFAGYSGGLSHDNVTTEIPLISKCVADEAWIEAGSGLVRDGLFSLGKAAAFLEAARPWVIMQWVYV